MIVSMTTRAATAASFLSAVTLTVAALGFAHRAQPVGALRNADGTAVSVNRLDPMYMRPPAGLPPIPPQAASLRTPAGSSCAAA